MSLNDMVTFWDTFFVVWLKSLFSVFSVDGVSQRTMLETICFFCPTKALILCIEIWVRKGLGIEALVRFSIGKDHFEVGFG